MKNKRDKRIDGVFEYLCFHETRGEKAFQILKDQSWFDSLFDDMQIDEIKSAFVSFNLPPECISVFAYPQYSAELMRVCSHWLTYVYIEPDLMDALCNDFKDPDRIKDICEAIYDFGTQYINDVPLSKTQKYAAKELAYTICFHPDLKICLPEATWNSELSTKILELDNIFSDSDELYARVQIKEGSTQKILCECIISIPSDGRKTIPWNKQLSLLAKARMNVEELLKLPKLNECSELLQLLIRYHMESETGMFFVDEGDEEDEPLYSLENRLALAEEIEKMGLQELIEVGSEELNSDDCLITVYSSACTAFNLIGSKL